MRNPIKYYGGKQLLSKLFTDYIPEHNIFVEVFGGAGNLLIAKDPRISREEIYNDIDSNIYNLFRVIRSRKLFKEFIRLVSLMPHSREQFYKYKKLFKKDKWITLSNVHRAAIYFYLLRTSFSATLLSWSFNSLSLGASVTSAYLTAVDGLPGLHDRLMEVQIDHCDFETVLKRYDSAETFFYLDPPYLPSERISPLVYNKEMSLESHKRLLYLLSTIKGKVLLSGYASKLYDRNLKDWNREEVSVLATASAKGRTKSSEGSVQETRRTEVFWYNYDKPISRIKSRVKKLI